MEDVIKREIEEGKKEKWIYDNHSDLVSEFIGQSESFKEYCDMRFRETHE